MINRCMKLDDILINERVGDEYAYHRSLDFDRKMRSLRNFISRTQNKEAMEIYKHASQAGKFHPEDVKRLRELMA